MLNRHVVIGKGGVKTGIDWGTLHLPSPRAMWAGKFANFNRRNGWIRISSLSPAPLCLWRRRTNKRVHRENCLKGIKALLARQTETSGTICMYVVGEIPLPTHCTYIQLFLFHFKFYCNLLCGANLYLKGCVIPQSGRRPA